MKNFKLILCMLITAVAASVPNYSFADDDDNGASVCVQGGCYVYTCSGEGGDRSCGWSFKAKSPLDRDFEQEQ